MGSAGGEVDELFDLKNAFYTGNFQQCIKEAQRLKPSDPSLSELRDTFLYRSYLALRKFGVVRDGITASSSEALKPWKTLANYMQNTSARAGIAIEMETAMSGSVDLNNVSLLLVAATVFVHETNYEAALRVLHPSDELECAAMKIQILLKMDRVDLARKELKAMTEKDDDATLTQLATAWVNLQMGGDKIQDAYYIYQELIDKFGATPLLLNGQASSFLQQGKVEEAEAALSEALEKDPGDADALVNSVVLAQMTGKPQEVTSRYLSQLRDDHPGHPFVETYATKESDLDRMVKQYALSAA